MNALPRFATALSLSALTASAVFAAGGRPKNVLFIAIDDLRPELGCYQMPAVHSPHIDALAARGVVFDHAYCQQAVCSPSRTSLLTGLRPDTTRVYDLTTHFRDTTPSAVPLPEWFKEHGYVTQAVGKIYHGGLDDPRSWSVAPQFDAGGDGHSKPVNPATPGEEDEGPEWTHPSWSMVPDHAPRLIDQKVAAASVAALRTLAAARKPFFLAVGFRKPHLSFDAPKRYYDLYPLDGIRLAPNPSPPAGMPAIAGTNFSELRRYPGIPKEGAIPDPQAKELIRGYLACVSYVDDLVGEVLAELEVQHLSEDTIVIFWGDHGWQLGEHGMWCKHTNFETSTRAPLIVAVPGPFAHHARSEALVEFVDVYPTLVDLAGLPHKPGLAGTSFAALLRNPAEPGKPAAFSQYPRGSDIMGYSVRTARFRYNEWVRRGQLGRGEPIARELYDETDDPEENQNLASHADQTARVTELARLLHAGLADPAVDRN